MYSGNSFNVELPSKEKLDPEFVAQYWHPNRFGVELAPERIRTKLHDIHPDLEITYHPLLSRWLVWYKRDRITHPLCPGWLLLFIVENSLGEFVPLDERVFAAIFEVSAFKHGDALKYWDRIQAEIDHDKEVRARSFKSNTDAFAAERYDWGLIKNIGPGSKFSNYHS